MKFKSIILFLLLCVANSFGQPLLVAVLMVKNEALVITETLQPFVDGGVTDYLIFDTGSTDGTQEVVSTFFKENGLSNFHIVQEPFIDFSTSRNHALDAAQSLFPHATFMIMPDAEWYMHNTHGLLQFCSDHQHDCQPAYLVPIRSTTLSFFTSRLIRCRAGVRFVGSVHEVLNTLTSVTLPQDIYFEWRPSQKGMEKSTQRWQRDRDLLLKSYEQNPADPRTLFYLAQTYDCLGDSENAYAFYKKRDEMQGWPEENFITKFRLGGVAQKLAPKDDANVCPPSTQHYLAAYAARPQRAEPLINMAQYYLDKGQMHLAFLFAARAAQIPYPEKDILFVEKYLYDFVRYDILGRCAWYVGEYELGEWAMRQALRIKPDETYLQRNLKFYTDRKPPAKVWSILICTLDERTEKFERIHTKLRKQIEANNLEDKIEILFFKDNRQHSIGFKRNQLLRDSQGEYVCSVDDDDDVHDQYISMIYEKLMQKPDCVSVAGIMTTNGENPTPFIHSIQYNQYATENGVYVRPPNHLNPIKRSIASQFSFPENNFGEDTAWAIQLAQSGLLKTEAKIDVPYYFYQYDGKYNTQPIQKAKPRVSIITSVYKGDEFIKGFLHDIIKQTIFKECELIIINANSPGNEDPIIQLYAARYPNIKYERLTADPGLYAVWNYAIKKAQADLITNANIDDRRNPLSLEMHACALEEDRSIDLVYSDYYITYAANETFAKNSYRWVVQPQEFACKNMYKCLPGPQPMWRKSVHDTYGYFDETFSSAGDFEFWNRASSRGALFKKVPGVSGLYYQNPQGISTDQDPQKSARRDAENELIVQRYQHAWGW